MSAFDALMAVNVLLAAAAVLRLRAATFIFAANQVVVLRALANIEAYGAPASQAFLPRALFSASQLETAAVIFGLATALLAVAVALPRSRGPLLRAEHLPATPRWALWLMAAFFVALALSSRTVLSAEYADPGRAVFSFGLSGGVQALAGSVLLYELYRRLLARQLGAVAAFAVLLGVFVATDYSKGNTGLASGYAVCGAMLLLGGERSGWRRYAALGAALLVAVLAAATVRGVRASMHAQGTQAVSAFFRGLVDDEQSKATQGEGVERATNAAQYAAHVLECIALYDAGISREWRSIYLPLEYTLKPALLVEPLGLQRSREAAWELRDHFVHGGGIYVLGELYWNGGHACVLLVTAALLLFSWLCDARARTSVRWLILFCAFAPGLVQGTGYGFAQIARGAINGLLAWAAFALLDRWRRSRQRATSTLVGTPASEALNH